MPCYYFSYTRFITSSTAKLIIFILRLTILINIFTPLSHANPSFKPSLMLANIYHQDIPLTKYWVSEKFDGVRAYWNGEQLISRQGNIYHAPDWFISEFPNTPLDGELWLGRQRFDELSGAVRKQTPDESEWRKIRFMVFDLPKAVGTFDQRLSELNNIIASNTSPYLKLVKQQKFNDEPALIAYLEEVIAMGGEGVMLHLGSAPYRSIRSYDLLKLKRYQDAEAVVIDHLPGKGKYEGMLGALLVATDDGRRFKIGSGFSDAQRITPPAIGTNITYKYFGFTNKGTPRFASFLRVRNAD